MNSAANNIEDLETPENWDFDNVQIQQPVNDPHAVVSVTFDRTEFGRIAIAARKRGLSLTEYIRESALQCLMNDETATHHATEHGDTVSFGNSTSN
jgi:hypothetical protein